MRFASITLLALSLIGCSATPYSPNEFDPLLTSIEQRLDLAHAVAVYKWDERLPVEAPDREQQVLAQVRQMAPDYNLSPERAAAFFDDQIEANKRVQHALINSWKELGQRPQSTRLDLANDIRPQLDRLQTTLLYELGRFRQPESKCKLRLAHALSNRTQDRAYYQVLVRATQQLCAK
jgi:chorismate mutase